MKIVHVLQKATKMMMFIAMALIESHKFFSDWMNMCVIGVFAIFGDYDENIFTNL